MTNDIPPTDGEILNLLSDADGGMMPADLLKVLLEKGYSREDVVQAFQRVAERGLITLSSGARLVAKEVKLPEAA